MEVVKRYGILTVGSVVLGISDYIFKFQNHFSQTMAKVECDMRFVLRGISIFLVRGSIQ